MAAAASTDGAPAPSNAPATCSPQPPSVRPFSHRPLSARATTFSELSANGAPSTSTSGGAAGGACGSVVAGGPASAADDVRACLHAASIGGGLAPSVAGAHSAGDHSDAVNGGVRSSEGERSDRGYIDLTELAAGGVWLHAYGEAVETIDKVTLTLTMNWPSPSPSPSP